MKGRGPAPPVKPAGSPLPAEALPHLLKLFDGAAEMERKAALILLRAPEDTKEAARKHLDACTAFRRDVSEILDLHCRCDTPARDETPQCADDTQ